MTIREHTAIAKSEIAAGRDFEDVLEHHLYEVRKETFATAAALVQRIKRRFCMRGPGLNLMIELFTALDGRREKLLDSLE